MYTDCFPEDVHGVILSFLPITTLFVVKSVCVLWKNIATKVLDIHHSKFTCRIKLYSEIISKRSPPCIEPWKADEVLCEKLYKIVNDNPVLDKIIPASNISDFCEPHTKSTIDTNIYLEGLTYEYPYDLVELSDIKLRCLVCQEDAHLPVMISYDFMTKEDSHRNYTTLYDVICRKCIDNRDEIRDYTMISNESEINLIVGFKQ